MQKIKHPLCDRQENRTWEASHRVNMGPQCLAPPPLCGTVARWLEPLLSHTCSPLQGSRCSHRPHKALERCPPALASSLVLRDSTRKCFLRVSVCLHLPRPGIKCRTHHWGKNKGPKQQKGGFNKHLLHATCMPGPFPGPGAAVKETEQNSRLVKLIFLRNDESIV